MTTIEVHRYPDWETPRSVCGEMLFDGKHVAFTLEPSRETPVHPNHPCIPSGKYKVILTMSPHLHYLTPELLDVPGRSNIRIHIGNKPEDVEGCTAVGLTHSTDWVGASGTAFATVMLMLKGKDDIQVIYLDHGKIDTQETL